MQRMPRASAPEMPTKNMMMGMMAGSNISTKDVNEFAQASIIWSLIPMVFVFGLLYFVYMFSQQLSNSLCCGSL